jgi:hypothetical protein
MPGMCTIYEQDCLQNEVKYFMVLFSHNT